MEAADFWNDPEVSQKKMKELKSMKDDVATYASLTTQFEDIETLIEMGYEENDATLIPEIEEMLTEFTTTYDAIRAKTLLSGEYDGDNAIVSLHAGAGEGRGAARDDGQSSHGEQRIGGRVSSLWNAAVGDRAAAVSMRARRRAGCAGFGCRLRGVILVRALRPVAVGLVVGCGAAICLVPGIRVGVSARLPVVCRSRLSVARVALAALVARWRARRVQLLHGGAGSGGRCRSGRIGIAVVDGLGPIVNDGMGVLLGRGGGHDGEGGRRASVGGDELGVGIGHIGRYVLVVAAGLKRERPRAAHGG